MNCLSFIPFKNNVSLMFIFIMCLIYSSICLSDFSFVRTLVCIQQHLQGGCLRWNQQSKIQYIEEFNVFQCFSQKTLIMTPNGPKLLKQIHPNDQILGYDFNTNSVKYERVIAWLHRDTQKYIEYIQIKTSQGQIYSASPGHNVAVINNGTVQFKFADKLVQGDQIFTIGRSQIIDSITIQFQKGLYSPYTQLQNFFILPSGSSDINNSELMLVHCLSLVQLPSYYIESIFDYFITDVFEYLGYNQHYNNEKQVYFHPSTYLLSLFQQKKPIKMKHDMQTGQNDATRQRSMKIVAIILHFLRMNQPILVQ